MVDPLIHAQMAQIIQDEKDLLEQKRKLEGEEIPLWKKRVALAREKGRDDLAEQAKTRARELMLKLGEIEIELESLADKKKNLRYQSRRPTGDAVRRAEAMVQSVRDGGLINPDEAALERKIRELANSNASTGARTDESTDVVLGFGDDDQDDHSK